MKMHLAAAMALLLVPGASLAQAPDHAAHAAKAQNEGADAKPPRGEITLQGCLEREAVWRKTSDNGKGGPLRSGLGQGNEYVMTMGKPVPGKKAEPMKNAPKDGRVFSLTGNIEKNMVPAIGRQIEVVGTVTEPKAESADLPIVKVTVWHPIADFCPATGDAPNATATSGKK
jgi:hypothetical protein